MELWVSLLIFFGILLILFGITIIILYIMYREAKDDPSEPDYDSLFDFVDKKIYGGNDKNGV